MAKHLNLYITGGWRPPGDGARAVNSDVLPTVGWSQRPPRTSTPAIAAADRDAHLRDGFFHFPTVLDGCHSGMSVTQEESFGPVLTVETFTDDDEAVRPANDTVYGLACAVWTQDAGKAPANTRNRAHLAEHQSTAERWFRG